jgi:hypothetical protein
LYMSYYTVQAKCFTMAYFNSGPAYSFSGLLLHS